MSSHINSFTDGCSIVRRLTRAPRRSRILQVQQDHFLLLTKAHSARTSGHITLRAFDRTHFRVRKNTLITVPVVSIQVGSIDCSLPFRYTCVFAVNGRS